MVIMPNYGHRRRRPTLRRKGSIAMQRRTRNSGKSGDGDDVDGICQETLGTHGKMMGKLWDIHGVFFCKYLYIPKHQWNIFWENDGDFWGNYINSL